MKKRIKRWITPVFLIGLPVVLTTCSEEEDYTDEGYEVSIEFCECY